MVAQVEARDPPRVPRRQDTQGALGAADEATIAFVLDLFRAIQPRTRASYRGTLRTWWRWCHSQNKQPWPAEAADVAQYIAHLTAMRCSRDALRRFRSLLRRAHRLAGLPDPFATAPVRAASGAYQPRALLSAGDEVAIEAVLDTFEGLAASSRTNYGSDLRYWWSWCVQRGVPAWPAESRDVAEYATTVLAGGGSLVTLQRQLRAVLGRAHRLAGLSDPSAAAAVRAALDPRDPESARRFTQDLRRAVTLTPAHDERIAAILTLFRQLRPNSYSAYRNDLRIWWRWCILHDREPWPAQPADVVEYITAVLDAGGGRANLPRRLRAVLGRAHRLAAEPDPFAEPAVATLLARQPQAPAAAAP